MVEQTVASESRGANTGDRSLEAKSDITSLSCYTSTQQGICRMDCSLGPTNASGVCQQLLH